jgi:hypothetical protein
LLSFTGTFILLRLAQATTSHADTSTTGWLDFTIPNETAACSSAAEFAAKVDDQLREPAVRVAARGHARIAASIEHPSGRVWLGEARLLDATGAIVGRRTIAKEAGSCAPISDALALVAALLLSTEPAATAAPAEPLAPTRSADEPAPTLATPRDAKASRRWTTSLEGGASSELGLLPGLGWAAEARAFAERIRSPVFVASAAFWREARATSSTGRGGALRLWTAGGAICPVWLRSPSRAAGLCAGGDIGRVHASGFGLTDSTSQDLWFADIAAGTEFQHCPLQTAYSRLHAARKAVAAALGEHVEDY